MNVEQNIDFILKEFKRLLDKHNISFWLLGGQLLEAVRSGCWLKTDNDLDIGIYRKDWEKVREILHDKSKNKHLYPYHSAGIGFDLGVIFNNTPCHIFSNWIEEDKSFLFIHKKTVFIKYSFPSKYIKTLNKITINNVEYFIPNNVESFLELYYGKDWRAPKKSWDSSNDPPFLDANIDFKKYILPKKKQKEYFEEWKLNWKNEK